MPEVFLVLTKTCFLLQDVPWHKWFNFFKIKNLVLEITHQNFQTCFNICCQISANRLYLMKIKLKISYCWNFVVNSALNHSVEYLSQTSLVFHQEFSEFWKFSLALVWIFVYSCLAVEFTAVRRTLIFFFFPQVSSVFSAFTIAHWMHNTQGSFSLHNPCICRRNPFKVSAECSAGSWKSAVFSKCFDQLWDSESLCHPTRGDKQYLKTAAGLERIPRQTRYITAIII